MIRLLCVLCALCRSSASTEVILRDQVDVIELNHFYDGDGRLVFDQLIYWEWDDQAERFQVVAWRLVRDRLDPPDIVRDPPAPRPRSPQIPVRVFPARPRHWFTHQSAISHQQFVATWHDGDILRQVRAPTFRETWTQHDPELAEREHLPSELRRELSRPSAGGR